MIRELAEFGKSIRNGHDALKDEPIDIDLIINDDGSFIGFSIIERIFRKAEAITAKKGKARLLLDKAEEVLGYLNKEFLNKKIKFIKEGKSEDEASAIALEEAIKSVGFKHSLFLKKIDEFNKLEILRPVLLFYNDNKKNGLIQALNAFESQVPDVQRNGNIAFRIKDVRLHEQKIVYDSIIENYENKESEINVV